MSIVEYAYALRKRWVAILVLAVLGAAAGYVAAAVTPDVYRSSGSVLVTSDRGDSTSELTQGSSFVQTTIPSFVVMATSDVVLDPVVEELELDSTAAQLSSLVTASSPLGTQIIEISVTHGRPERAQEIAEAVLDSLVDVIPQVSPRSSTGQESVNVTIIQQPHVPRFAIAPNTRLSVALGGIAGIVLGVVYALGRRLIGDHISDPRDVAQVTDAPVLGQVLESRRNQPLPQLLLRDPLSPEAESVRNLAANVNFLRVDGGLRAFVITSANQGEGKSTVAIALGLVAAESGKRVLLIDADLRRPSIARATGLEGGVGLTSVLLGDVEAEDATQAWARPGLSVITSGPVPPNPTQLLSSDAMKDLIASSEAEYDLVIIDAGPVLNVSDAIWLSHATSGALVIARWGRTARRRFVRALSALDRAESRTLGIVMTRKPRRGASRYGYAADAEPTREDADHPRRSRFGKGAKKKPASDGADPRDRAATNESDAKADASPSA